MLQKTPPFGSSIRKVCSAVFPMLIIHLYVYTYKGTLLLIRCRYLYTYKGTLMLISLMRCRYATSLREDRCTVDEQAVHASYSRSLAGRLRLCVSRSLSLLSLFLSLIFVSLSLLCFPTALCFSLFALFLSPCSVSLSLHPVSLSLSLSHTSISPRVFFLACLTHFLPSLVRQIFFLTNCSHQRSRRRERRDERSVSVASHAQPLSRHLSV